MKHKRKPKRTKRQTINNKPTENILLKLASKTNNNHQHTEQTSTPPWTLTQLATALNINKETARKKLLMWLNNNIAAYWGRIEITRIDGITQKAPAYTFTKHGLDLIRKQKMPGIA